MNDATGSLEEDDPVLNVQEASKALGLSAFTVRNKCRCGAIRARILVAVDGKSKQLRIRKSELRRFLQEGDLNPPELPVVALD